MNTDPLHKKILATRGKPSCRSCHVFFFLSRRVGFLNISTAVQLFAGHLCLINSIKLFLIKPTTFVVSQPLYYTRTLYTHIVRCRQFSVLTPGRRGARETTFRCYGHERMLEPQVSF